MISITSGVSTIAAEINTGQRTRSTRQRDCRSRMTIRPSHHQAGVVLAKTPTPRPRSEPEHRVRHGNQRIGAAKDRFHLQVIPLTLMLRPDISHSMNANAWLRGLAS
jgi:hypothetical protein